jgi:hypothetical protein
VKRIVNALIVVLIIITLLVPPSHVYATSGTPNSLKFGYGARLDLTGEQVDTAINLASGLGLDWIQIEFDWQRLWPDEARTPNLDSLDQAISLAHGKGLSILLSIIHPPAWAVNPTGPNPNLTAELVSLLFQRYPGNIEAVELFPGINTQDGCGASPDPASYINVLLASHQAILENNSPAYLVTTLVPTESPDGTRNIDDREYLDQLFNTDYASLMPIIGLHYIGLTGVPLAEPGQGKGLVLRHYEEIRKILLQHGHQESLIWITSFSWPKADIQNLSEEYSLLTIEEAQDQWLSEAYKLIHSQLYLGAAFFEQLNWNPQKPTVPSLLLPDSSLHPTCQSIGYITNLAQVSARNESPLPDEIIPDLKSMPNRLMLDLD